MPRWSKPRNCNQVTRSAEEVEDLKSEVRLAHEACAQLQQQVNQLNLAQDNDDESRAVNFRKVADDMARSRS